MLRKILPVFAFCLLASLSVRAQDKVEVFGGYSYMHFHSSPSVSLNGWEASAQYKFTDWIGGVADFDGHYGSLHGASTSTYTYLFGPQVSYPARISPFGHLLLGGAHLGVGGFGSSSFSMALGGGFDMKVHSERDICWRIFQGDYLLTQFGGNAQNNFRFSTGILFRF